MKNKIDTIIFDLGGVLVDWNPAYLYNKVFNGNIEKMNWFLTTVCNPQWNIEQDAGRKIEEGVALKIAEFPEYENEIKLFYEKWDQMFAGAIKQNVNLLKQLKASKKYKLYALTNWSAEKWDKALELFPFFNDFEGVVVSGIEKCRKPFPEIYHILLNRFQIIPENALFIDDNLENITAAENLHVNGIHFNKKTNLYNELKLYNITL